MTAVDIVVRKALPKDIDAMCGLLKLLFAIETDFAYDGGKQRCGLELMLQQENAGCVLVAELNQTIIGMCSAQLLVSTAEGGLKAVIEDVVIMESYRGQRIGRRLLTTMAEWAVSQGAKRLDLLADQRNQAALSFYRKLGWCQTELVCLQKKL
ncbi:GNAT family N-acetyltransferase [Sporomusa malonica]|uniref:Ribosomal protein S18 acetylase RimI n=1 Tax=Sporomusa malonica TaxID=112901 RepID=A0A1W2BET9_9FIRM|nr:GNAT family N-acetyltransferase [Sporomusa malonica]SMC71351.1 Ribosomal protein S18 acetylase RimI [Sporomusa malonica]